MLSGYQIWRQQQFFEIKVTSSAERYREAFGEKICRRWSRNSSRVQFHTTTKTFHQNQNQMQDDGCRSGIVLYPDRLEQSSVKSVNHIWCWFRILQRAEPASDGYIPQNAKSQFWKCESRSAYFQIYRIRARDTLPLYFSESREQ